MRRVWREIGLREVTMTWTLRAERSADVDAIRSVVDAAFGQAEEGKLVDALRAGGFLRSSLVAVDRDKVVGHVLFSAMKIVTPTGPIDALALAPVAVVPDWQNQGIGSALIRRGLDDCRAQGHRIVLVVGHAAYYPRFGFSAELARQLDSPYAGDSFMALELVDRALENVRGSVEYAPPFTAF